MVFREVQFGVELGGESGDMLLSSSSFRAFASGANDDSRNCTWSKSVVQLSVDPTSHSSNNVMCCSLSRSARSLQKLLSSRRVEGDVWRRASGRGSGSEESQMQMQMQLQLQARTRTRDPNQPSGWTGEGMLLLLATACYCCISGAGS